MEIGGWRVRKLDLRLAFSVPQQNGIMTNPVGQAPGGVLFFVSLYKVLE